MQVINDGGLEIAFVVDEDRRLVGTVSDGDIRRALLGGAKLDDGVLKFANRHCISVSLVAGRSAVLDEMRARGLSQIPIVDEQNRFLGVHMLREMIGGMERPNWAVIMAGGRGERLRPLTNTIPKPMIKVAGRPILERLVLHYVGFGIRTIFLSVNYMSHVIRDHFGDGSRFGCEIRYLEELQPLGTAGALSLLPEHPEHPFLVTNGDLITEFDVDAILRFHYQQQCCLTTGIREYQHTVPFGTVDLDGVKITNIREKPTLVCLVNTGVYVLEPRLIERIPKDTAYTMPELIDDCLRRNEDVGGYFIGGDWIDVGRPTDLHAARGAT
jgi:dTDP-glucose pyrophosphorylase